MKGKKYFYPSGKYYCQTLFIIIMLAFNLAGNANPILKIVQPDNSVPLSPFLYEYIDTGKNVSPFQEPKAEIPFTKTDGKTRVYTQNVKSVWLKFSIENNTDQARLYLNIPYANLSVVSLYEVRSDGTFQLVGRQGNATPATPQSSASPNLYFKLPLQPGEQKEYILHVFSDHPILLPAFVSTTEAFNNALLVQTVIISMYIGVLLIMFLYNLFLFFATRDNNYLLYTVYILFLALAQVTVSGYGYRYLWPQFVEFNRYAVIITSSISAIAAITFAIYFLQTRSYSPKIDKVLKALIVIYILGILASFFGWISAGYFILNYNSLLSVIFLLTASILIARKGFRAAYFYLIAWIALLFSFLVLVLRNLNVLPYNSFTAYVFYIGSAIEVALLSMALADKINTLRREKEASQAAALKASLQNEQWVREQNVVLEKKVAERTEELQETNQQLTEAFSELKDAQIQLVEAEKMASLGQLTAGIAHEINNPINFVKSNIKPLQLDFKDIVQVLDEYEKLHTSDPEKSTEQLKLISKLKKDLDLDFLKDEITNLLNGIKEGADRTAEIVRGLRTFSRLDESQIKTVNIHEGIESTLVLLRNSSPDHVKISFDFKANGNIECFPGKLNQVFMNIVSNAIQAIKSKSSKEPESIIISTKDVGTDEVEIRVKDSGPGMSPEVKQKIFDPFFTTKDVGEGTGLGLAIVFKIIQEHSGRIDVISAAGEGAEFIITLHHIVPEKPAV